MTEGRVVKAEHVHHIVELEENASLALADDNLISLSAATHSAISRVYKDTKKRHQMQEKFKKLYENMNKNFDNINKRFEIIDEKFDNINGKTDIAGNDSEKNGKRNMMTELRRY